MSRNKIIERDIEVLIWQPNEKPSGVLNMITDFCQGEARVESAFFACIQYPGENETIKLLIGIESTESLESVDKKLVAYLDKNEFALNDVEFVDVSVEPFKQYFSRYEPFYKKLVK